MPKVAIVAALEREVEPLVKSWRVHEQQYSGRRLRFFESGQAVVVCGGIGSEAARRAAEAAMALYGPELVCSAGFAGALDKKLKVGDLFRPGRIIDASDGSSVTVDRTAGVLVSFASVAGPAQKSKLQAGFGADAVDMEAAAVGRAAEARGVEFSVIKAISDEVDFEFPATERFISPDGRFLTASFAWFAACRPWLWGKVMRLERNSRRAARSLCDGLRAGIVGAAGGERAL